MVKVGQTTEVKVSGFLGQTGPSRDFNRIIVKADRGEIMNGVESSSDPKARVFKVGRGVVSVEYKAPESCEEKTDTIRVYNSCDIAKAAQIPLTKTAIRDEIAAKEVEIECEWEWTGTITIQQTYRFDCEGERRTDDVTVQKIKVSDISQTKATMNIKTKDIGVADEGIEFLSGRDITIRSGMFTFSRDLSDDRKSVGKERIYAHTLRTSKENGTSQIEQGVLSLTFMKENITSNPAEFQKSSGEGTADDKDETIPIKIHLNLIAGCKVSLERTSFREEFNATAGGMVTTTDDSWTQEEDHPVAMAVPKMDAQYIKTDNGQARIVASYNETSTRAGSYDVEYGCPPVSSTLRCSIQLTRQLKKE